ncbi:SH3 domain-containing protein [Cognatishimia sp. F0-27]|uniref:SH3 domain-containing protein n=1 Tax=Cognatishimia sp. F0-27 TaxID=2816855 RepID=UPI001D0BFDD0|nr:SH3 domain-containing protein [Cognatishimia sp. F0-27]MCC1494650.1 SH3 domain-containing protein [Cognatishimia sp. F0-27]
MKSKVARWLLAAVSAASVWSGAVAAQSQTEVVNAFSGEWFVFDSSFGSNGSTCQLVLQSEAIKDEPQDNPRRSLVTRNCIDAVSQASAWKIVDGKIAVLTSDGATLAALGGVPTRLTGELSVDPGAMIVERANGNPDTIALTAALRKHGCYYVGYTAECAKTPETRPPEFEEGAANISILTTLNVRNQPRRDAPIIGTVPPGAELTIDACLRASDGYWCRASFGEAVGWMAKSAIRQSEWPVITFTNAL